MKHLFATIADIHLNDNNIVEVSTAFKKAVDICVERKIEDLFMMGDFFTNRKSLSFEILQASQELFDYIHGKVKLYMYPGNHDKISYTSERSYLDIFKYQPGVQLYDTLTEIRIGEIDVFIMPFLDEKTALIDYIESLKKTKISENSILLTHIAVDGVRNNDGSEVEETLNREIFSKFKLVLVGHYHNKQQIDNVIYTGSLLQNNYGEDELKGLTIVHDDYSLEQIPLADPKYLTVDVDLSKYSMTELKETLVEIYKDTSQRIRFKVTGDREQLKNIDREYFLKNGIDLEFKETLDETITEEAITEFNGFNKQKITEEWSEFCDKESERKKYKKIGQDLIKTINE
jgi:exonuclease SbcD